MGSDWKLLTSRYKSESIVWYTTGVQMIGMSILLTRNIRSLEDANFLSRVRVLSCWVLWSKFEKSNLIYWCNMVIENRLQLTIQLQELYTGLFSEAWIVNFGAFVRLVNWIVFNDFPICQWKSLWSKVTLVLTVLSPIFGGLGSCLTFSQSHPLSRANCSCSFQV